MSDFVLTNENYYSHEADMRYMSVHQYLDFCGHMGIIGCEAHAMAKLTGKWQDPVTDAMLVGSYVDSYFEGTQEEFISGHLEIFTKGKEKRLLAKYRQADMMIERCLQDPLFMDTMSGQSQTIMTAPLFGCNWKIKIDSYLPGKAIVDLKTSANIHKMWKVQDYGYATFIEYWGYTLQLAVYQKVVEINTGKKLPCYISAVTKEDSPEIKVIYIDQMSLDHALNEIEMNMPTVLAVKNGEIEPTRCGMCDYCKKTEVLQKPIRMEDLILGE